MDEGHGAKLERVQEQAIAALLRHGSLRRAAEAVQVDESTLRRWLKEPAFAAAYQEARWQVMHAAIARMQRAMYRAVRTLEKELRGATAADRIRAANALLDRGLRGAELLDLAERVEEVERRSAASRERRR
jgi:hypothetical protein